MLVRDVRTGRLVAVPDNRFNVAPLSGYGAASYAPRSPYAAANGSGFAAAPQQVIYDGLGNPLGLPFLAALAPMAASLLPSLLPLIPSLASGAASLFKSIGRPLSGVPTGGPGFGYYPAASMHGLGAVPELGYYGATPPQVMYDGLGNPLGLPFLAALAPALSSLLPSLAGGAAKVLPGLLSQVASALPSLVQSVAPSMANVSPMPMPPPTPGPLPSGAPMPDAGPPAMAPVVPAPMQPPESIVAPMRVQGPNGQPMVVPVRLRRRRRGRGRRMRRAQPLVVAPPPASGVGFAPRFASPSNLHGWYGFNGWRGG